MTIVAQVKHIDTKEAMDIVMNDAKIKSDNITHSDIVSDKEHDTYIYKIQFQSKTNKYIYIISYRSGDILRREVTSLSSVKDTTSNKGIEDTNEQLIHIENAKKKALEDADVSSNDAKFIKEKVDWEDGIQIYDIEFIANNMTYEYEIVAQNGAVHKRSSKVSKQKSNFHKNSYILVDEAKKEALHRAGLSADEVTFVKSKLEHNDSKIIYEIEFVKDAIEFEYKIDAITGEILESELDM